MLFVSLLGFMPVYRWGVPRDIFLIPRLIDLLHLCYTADALLLCKSSLSAMQTQPSCYAANAFLLYKLTQ